MSSNRSFYERDAVAQPASSPTSMAQSPSPPNITPADLLHPSQNLLYGLMRGLSQHQFIFLNHQDVAALLPQLKVQRMLAEPNPVCGIEPLVIDLLNPLRSDLRDTCARVIDEIPGLKQEIIRDRAPPPRFLDDLTEEKLARLLEPVREQMARKPACMEGTRERILSDLVEQAAAALNGPDRIIWIHGVAGAGKTAIMGSLAARLCSDNRFASTASFHCARDIEARRSVLRILPSIAWDLSQSVVGFGRSIADSHFAAERAQSLRGQLEHFVLAPWRRSGSCSAAILVDALDECADSEDVCIFLEAILSSTSAAAPMVFVIAGRDVPPLSNRLPKWPPRFTLNISADKQRNSANNDIQRPVFANYPEDLHSQLQRSLPALMQQAADYQTAVKRICAQSGGIFMCASVVCSALPFDTRRVSLLRDIMEQRGAFGEAKGNSLYKLYRTVLAAAFMDAIPPICEHARCVLGVILYAANPLRSSTIHHFASSGSLWSEDETFQILRLCKPLLSWDGEDSRVAFMHASVADFFRSGSDAFGGSLPQFDFYIDTSRHQSRMAHRCLDTLYDLHFNMYDLAFPGQTPRKVLPEPLHYACTHWVNHLSACSPPDAELVSRASDLLRGRFLFWLEVLAARSEVGRRGVPMMQRLLDTIGPEPDPFVVDCEVSYSIFTCA